MCITMKIHRNLNIILFVLLFISAPLTFCQKNIFKQLNTSNGLSNNNVYDIIQDNQGFMWFATEDGLNRFDGYNFKIFRKDPENSNSLPDNFIRALAESSDGNIWIGTQNGYLTCYNPYI
jgi:ligand-binding sensor domain-containing protein